MKEKTCFLGLSTGAALYAVALCGFGIWTFPSAAADEIPEFPLAGGYLDSAEAWGGEVPTGTFELVNPGVYRISGDTSFGTMKIMSGAITNDFGEYKMTSSVDLGIHRQCDGTVTFSGGEYRTGELRCHFDSDSDNGRMVFTDGCVVTCTNTFYAARWSKNTHTKITGGSKIYVENLRLQNDSGSNNELEVCDGGELHVLTRMYSEVWINGAGQDGFNRFVVRGTGSIFKVESNTASRFGHHLNDILFLLTDGARAESSKAGVYLGSVSATNAQLRIENRAYADFYDIKFNSRNNLFAIGSCATAKVDSVTLSGSNNVMSVSGGALADIGRFDFSGSCNSITVSNAVLKATQNTKSARSMLGSGSNSSNNVLRVIGPDAGLSIASAAWDMFGKGHHNTLSIEDGAQVWLYLARTMTNTHHSVISVTGEGSKLSTSWFYLGSKDEPTAQNFTVSNTVYVGDGAVIDADRFVMTGVDNRLVVSNATVNLTDPGDGLGFAAGRRTFDGGNALVLQGTTPKITCPILRTDVNRFTFADRAVLRFEIPEEGYAKGHTVIDILGRFTFAEGATLEIDCEDFVARTGGRLHLISAAVLSGGCEEALRKAVLPEGARLEISGGDVYLRSPLKVGFVLTVR